MRKFYILFFLITTLSFGQSVFINEIHYDNVGTDEGEAIEIAGPATTDLTDWKVVLYNGSNGTVYETINLSGTIPDQQNGFGTLTFSGPSSGFQNGAPDGLALVNASNTVIQFLSYEGVFTAVGGFADGLTSSDIGVTEVSSTPVGFSLQLTGSGDTYGEFTWAAAQANTMGAKNTGQTFTTVNAATLSIFDGPPNGSTVVMGPEDINPSILFEVTNFVVGVPSTGDGYIVWDTLEGVTPLENGQVQNIATPITPTLEAGKTYTLNAKLVDNTGADLNPAVTFTTTVTFKDYIQVANLAALRAGTVGEYYEVTGEVIATWAQTYRNQKWAQDATAGIMFDDTDGVITTNYNGGDGITGIKGQLALYNGLIQLIPTVDVGPATTTGNTIAPEVVTISQLLADHEPYESELIEIQGVTFEDGDGLDVFGNTLNYNISDIGGGPIPFSTFMLRDGDYIGNLIPTGAKDVILLVGDFNGVQVAARSLSDLTLSVIENQIEGFAMYPNPVSTGKISINSASRNAKQVDIFSVIGNLVYSKTVNDGEFIDISNLTTGFYMVRVKEEGKIATRKLLVN